MAAIRPTVGAAAAVWGTSGGRGAGEDKIILAKGPPLTGCVVGGCAVGWGAVVCV